MRRITATLLCWLIAASAQQAPAPPAAPAQEPAVRFSSNSQLVVEIVTVNDKDGKPIEGLTARDFAVTENGQPQTIKFLEYQRLEQVLNPTLPALAPRPPVSATPPAQVAALTQNQIKPEAPGDIRYRDKRLLVLYFDMSAMPPADQLRALSSAEKFISHQIQPADLVAVMEFSSGAVRVLQDFTDERDLMRAAVDKIAAEAQGIEDENTGDTGAAFGQDDGEFNLFNTDRQLAALQTAAKMLGTLNEKKALIYFASGMRLNGVDNQAQLRSTLNAAIRANVAFYPIDARGLVASAPLGDATRGSPGGMGMYSGQGALAAMSSFQRSQDTMYALAADTGGKALLDYNDLSMGIVQAQKAITSYYILGYYTTNETLDGKFRKISITLKEYPNAKLDYRQGYFAGKDFTKFTTADKERQLEDALMMGDPITDLTIAMEVNYFQLNRAEYYVPVVMKVPGSELALARKGGAERSVIDFIGEIKDEYGTTIQNIRDKVEIKFSGETAAQLAKKHIEYDTGYTLLPGPYTIKVLARDAETGRIGTYMSKFVVPNLNREEKRIPISSVVLSGQRVPLADAVFTAGKDKEQVSNPLVQDGQKLIPSVTRVFNRNRDLFVYLQAYQQTAETAQPLVVYVTFYRGAVKAFETPPMPVTEALNNRLKTTPMKLSISLAKLPPGRYDCQVTVLDPKSQKAAFWQTQVALVQ